MTKDIEREAFEEALAGNKIHNLHICTIFDEEKMNILHLTHAIQVKIILLSL